MYKAMAMALLDKFCDLIASHTALVQLNDCEASNESTRYFGWRQYLWRLKRASYGCAYDPP